MFEKKKILVLGFAKSGYEAAKLLIKKNNEILINDYKNVYNEEETCQIKELEALGVKFLLGSHPKELLDNTYDYLIKNPGIAIDHPYVLKAKELAIPVINEVEVAYNLIPKDKNIKIIAVTGTNGKTTTTTLIYEMLKQAKLPVVLAGNIGYPLCSVVENLQENDIIVMEISCQQLENIDKFNPDIAVMTNIDVAHLEFMKTFDHYKEVKSRLLKNQTEKNVAILNKKDDELVKFSKNTNAHIQWFNSESGCHLLNNFIYYKNEEVININNIILKGNHNYENIMAAIMVCKQFNVNKRNINNILKKFTGVEHRLELVACKNGRSFYNDTEATNIKCTQIALSSFKDPIILLLGGYERNQNFDDLKPYLNNVKSIVGIGECRERVKDFGNKNNIKTYAIEHLKEAFKKCYELSDEGDIILLSPASASWDQYKRCEERGDEFKKYVNEL